MLSRRLNRRVIDKTISVVSNVPNWTFWRSTSIKLEKNRPQEQDPKSTLDPSDVELFSNQMKEWWNLDGSMRLLHRFNAIRVPFVRDGLTQCSDDQRELLPLKDKKILDVGCGGGILTEGLARLGANVTGIDASKELINVAQSHGNVDPKVAKFKPTYYHTTVEDHAKKFASHYDAVVASEIIEHVNNQELFVKSCIHALKPGGRIFITTPNRTRLSQLFVIYLSENVLKIIPKGAHQYEKFITPNELTFILERNNCQVESTYGIQYNPLNNRWDFTSFQQLHYALQALKLS